MTTKTTAKPPNASRDDTPDWLLRKYDVSAPRYTSYPSIPFWRPTTSEEVTGWLGEPSGTRDNSLSVYVHIPFCVSRCFYCGCNVVVTSKREQATSYIEALKTEMRLVRERTLVPQESGLVRQFQLGGGTPTFITPDEMADLVNTVRELYPFEAEPEMGIEIDPRTVNRNYLTRLRELGFNRISLGVQDFDGKVMGAVNRAQTFELVAELMAHGRKLGFRSINFDLIYGLPEQREATFARTLEQVRELAPDRLAIYNYAHLPRIFPYQRRFDPETLPGPEEKLALIQMARRRLDEFGYHSIGMDHFALPGDDLAVAFREGSMRRNFMGYATQAGTDQLAFGMSAISEFHRSFWQNEKKLIRYYRAVDEGRLPVVRGIRLNEEDLLRKQVIENLFCRGGIEYEELRHRFGIEFKSYMACELEALGSMEADGLVELNATGLQVTARGQLFLRNISMVFDPYLRKEEGGSPQFSRAL
ncbi:MAG: oxygen-independent coproporphyrinogen III oxidase [SAR324 cluster bacterium]|nr:oxygen-independent coproporphyrinogen III oxidase [SAR324 cluster bacterium]